MIRKRKRVDNSFINLNLSSSTANEILSVLWTLSKIIEELLKTKGFINFQLGVAGAFAQKVTVMNEKFSQTHLKTVTFGSNLPSEIINKIGSIGNHMLVWK